MGSVGHLSVVKNHIFLIRLLEAYYKYDRNVCLLIIGEGEEGEMIMREAKMRGIDNNLLILSPKKNISPYYNLMDFYVHPSLHEGLPYVCLEAQVNGLPVIASLGVPEDIRISEHVYREELSVEKWMVYIMKIREIEHENPLNERANIFDSNQSIKTIENKYEKMMS